jgi:DNA-binding winged helix-turn-helix (wHTH) protein
VSGLIQFGEFVLDCNRYELLRAGHPIKLEKFPMELLILLVTRGGHLVTPAGNHRAPVGHRGLLGY